MVMEQRCIMCRRDLEQNEMKQRLNIVDQNELESNLS
jgi:hypothetical protein